MNEQIETSTEDGSAIEIAAHKLMNAIAEVGYKVSKASIEAGRISSDLIDCVHELEELTGRMFEAE